jgi:hypothetical protein
MVSSWVFESVGSLLSNATGELLPGAIGQLGNFAPQIIGNIVPIIGTAIAVITNLIQGNIKGASLIGAGAIIGSFIPGIGTAIGAIIGGIIDFITDLFKEPPHAHLDVQLQGAFMDAQADFMKGLVGTIGVFVSSAAIGFGSPEALRIQREIADGLSAIVRQLLGATLTAQSTLPISISESMTRRLRDLATRGLFLDPAGNSSVELESGEFQHAIEALPNKLIKGFAEAVFGGLDISALQQSGEALGDTFSRVLNSMVGLAGLMKAVGMDADAFTASLGTGDEALRAYVTASLDFFASFRVGTETFTETVARISGALGGVQVIFQAMGRDMPQPADLAGLTTMLQRSIAFFTGFAKEGEKFDDTVKRVVGGIVGLVNFSTELGTAIAGLTNDTAKAVALVQEQLAIADRQIEVLTSRLSDAVSASGSPDDILAMAQALTKAITDRYQAEINLARSLADAVSQLQQAALATIASIAELDNALISFGTGGAERFISSLDNLIALFNQTQVVESHVVIFQAAVSGFINTLNTLIDQGVTNLTDFFNTVNVTLAQGFEVMMTEIAVITDPQRAVANLQALAGVILQYENDLIDAAQRFYAEARQLEQALSQQRIEALQAERDAIQEAASAQIDALQAQRSALQDAADARLDALRTERDAIQDAAQAQIDALQTQRDAIQDAADLRLDVLNTELDALNEQLRLSEEWARVLDSTKSTIKDMLLTLSNQQHALERLELAKGFVTQAQTTFAATGSPEAAQALQQALEDELRLAQEAFQRPSAAYQQIFLQVMADLQALQGVAEANTVDTVAIQARIAELTAEIKTIQEETKQILTVIDTRIDALNAQTKASLASIDAQMAEVSATLRAQLSSIDAQISRVQSTLQSQLSRIDERIAQERLALTAVLADLSRQETETVTALRLEASARLEEIRAALVERLVALQAAEQVAADRLHALIGDRTLDQFIADINVHQANLLTHVRDYLASYLPPILNVLMGLPAFQHGIDYVPQRMLAVLDPGERVLTSSENAALMRSVFGSERDLSGGGASFSPTIHVTVESGATGDAEKIAKVVRHELLDLLKNGPAGKLVDDRVRRGR